MTKEIRGLNIPRVGIQVEGEHYEKWWALAGSSELRRLTENLRDYKFTVRIW